MEVEDRPLSEMDRMRGCRGGLTCTVAFEEADRCIAVASSACEKVEWMGVIARSPLRVMRPCVVGDGSGSRDELRLAKESEDPLV